MMNTWDEEVQKEMERNNLLIVDSLNLAFRWKHRGQSDFAAELVKTINSLARSYGAREVVVLADYKGSSYRKELHPLYKSDRKKKYADQTEEDKEAAALFFEGFNRALELCERNFTCIKLAGVEADDVAAYLVEQFEDGDHFDHIWMMSTDQDWDELLSPACSRFAYTTRKEYTFDNFYEMHGCDTPAEFTSMKAIMGDMGDSVYGIDGIGAKRAYNLVRQYGSALDLYESLPLEGKQKYVLNLNSSEDTLVLNTQLVDLRGFYKEAIAHPNEENLEILEQICDKLKGEI